MKRAILELLYELSFDQCSQLRFCQLLSVLWVAKQQFDMMTWEYKILDPFHRSDEETLINMLEWVIEKQIILSDDLVEILDTLKDWSKLWKKIDLINKY